MKYILLASVTVLVISCSPAPNNKSESASLADTITVSTQATDTFTKADALSPWQEKINRGIDFIGKGNEPFWSVEIDFETSMRFTSMSGDSLYTLVPTPSYAQDAPIVRYAASTEAGTLQVTLERRTCIDDMSGQEYPFTVSVNFKKGKNTDYQSYKGCGQYIGTYQLDNVWILETMNGKPVDTTLFTGNKPNIQFRLAQNKMFGFGGCNRLQASIERSGDTLRLGQVISTKMACPASAFETTLLNQLSEQSFTFQVSQERLVLQNKQHILTFKPLN